MGIETAECPECGATVRFGVPRTGHFVERAPADEAPKQADGVKTRLLACPNGHEFAVRFTF